LIESLAAHIARPLAIDDSRIERFDS